MRMFMLVRWTIVRSRTTMVVGVDGTVMLMVGGRGGRCGGSLVEVVRSRKCRMKLTLIVRVFRSIVCQFHEHLRLVQDRSVHGSVERSRAAPSAEPPTRRAHRHTSLARPRPRCTRRTLSSTLSPRTPGTPTPRKATRPATRTHATPSIHLRSLIAPRIINSNSLPSH